MRSPGCLKDIPKEQYCAAGAVEIERLFALVLFNYVTGNGDAHLKNFSLIESPAGDYILSPAYDLISTSVHFPDESRTALELFDEYFSESYKSNGFYKRTDFMELSAGYGMKEARAARQLDFFCSKSKDVLSLIERSFLSEGAKKRYRDIFNDRMKAIVD